MMYYFTLPYFTCFSLIICSPGSS